MQQQLLACMQTEALPTPVFLVEPSPLLAAHAACALHYDSTRYSSSTPICCPTGNLTVCSGVQSKPQTGIRRCAPRPKRLQQSGPQACPAHHGSPASECSPRPSMRGESCPCLCGSSPYTPCGSHESVLWSCRLHSSLCPAVMGLPAQGQGRCWLPPAEGQAWRQLEVLSHTSGWPPDGGPPYSNATLSELVVAGAGHTWRLSCFRVTGATGRRPAFWRTRWMRGASTCCWARSTRGCPTTPSGGRRAGGS